MTDITRNIEDYPLVSVNTYLWQDEPIDLVISDPAPESSGYALVSLSIAEAKAVRKALKEAITRATESASN